jgi:hypothetical protein
MADKTAVSDWKKVTAIKDGGEAVEFECPFAGEYGVMNTQVRPTDALYPVGEPVLMAIADEMIGISTYINGRHTFVQPGRDYVHADANGKYSSCWVRTIWMDLSDAIGPGAYSPEYAPSAPPPTA